MAVTPAQVRARFAEFASTDLAVVQAAIDEAELRTNREAWGDKADTGVMYLTAHTLKLDAGGAAAAPGPMSSQSVGPLSRSFVASSTSSRPEASTAYGRRYLELLAGIYPSRVLGCP